MSGERDGTDLYTLYAVVVHLGNSTAGGHYICFTKDDSGHWYKIDDAMVTPLKKFFVPALLYNALSVILNTILSQVRIVDVQQVLAQKAYMLLYSRCYPIVL